MVFDLLVDGQGRSLAAKPLSARRMALQEFAAANLEPSPHAKHSKKATTQATLKDPMIASCSHLPTLTLPRLKSGCVEGAASGWDGVVAKRLDCEYMSGERTGMVKIKRIRTADCVVGGFRWARGKNSESKAADSKSAHLKTADTETRPTEEVGSLLLGLYNKSGELDHIGFSASFTREDRHYADAIQAAHGWRRIFR